MTLKGKPVKNYFSVPLASSTGVPDHGRASMNRTPTTGLANQSPFGWFINNYMLGLNIPVI